jgi:Arc/MetJ-type ribon-helix-helix transcriptional regulator
MSSISINRGLIPPPNTFYFQDGITQGVVRASYPGYAVSMKISVSLPDEDVEFLDEYAKTQGYESRSAVVHTAVRMLRSSELGDAYADAWLEWDNSGESEIWETAVGDGLT